MTLHPLKQFNLPDWIKLLFALVAAVVFMFTNFQLKADSDREANRTRDSLSEIKRDLERIDTKLDHLIEKR